MNVPLRRIKSIVHVCVWIFLVVAGWFLWSIFLFLDIWSYALPLILGLGVGILSGLNPARAFLVSFLGFFILGILYNTLFPHVIFGLTLFGILCGLFAVVGAILRRIILRKRIEEIYLTGYPYPTVMKMRATVLMMIRRHPLSGVRKFVFLRKRIIEAVPETWIDTMSVSATKQMYYGPYS